MEGEILLKKKIGITGVGTYLPYHLMSREAIAGAWGIRGQKGTRTVAGADEDSVTMAVEAAFECMKDVPQEEIDTVYFASVTQPYSEKSHAAIISTVACLHDAATTADIGGSTKASLSAVKMAVDAVKAGTAKQLLVTAADCRNAYPKSQQEQLLGDAAAAVCIGSEGILATIDGYACVTAEITDIWRMSGQPYISTAEARFVSEKGYQSAMKSAVCQAMSKQDLTPDDFAKVVLSTPGMKDNIILAKKLGFAPEQLQDAFMQQVGYCGNAQPLLLLADALEAASPGDRLLVAAYGNGAEAFVLTATEKVIKLKNRRTLSKYLDNTVILKDYGRMLSFRGILEPLPGEPFKIPDSTSMAWREQGTYLRLEGSECLACGTTVFPVHRVCPHCREKDNYRVTRNADKIVEVFTYSIDKLAGRSDDPVIVQTVAEDKEGARFYLIMTDFAQEEIRVGMKVEFTFRKIHELGGYINYYWKFRPVRRGGNCHER